MSVFDEYFMLGSKVNGINLRKRGSAEKFFLFFFSLLNDKRAKSFGIISSKMGIV